MEESSRTFLVGSNGSNARGTIRMLPSRWISLLRIMAIAMVPPLRVATRTAIKRHITFRLIHQSSFSSPTSATWRARLESRTSLVRLRRGRRRTWVVICDLGGTVMCSGLSTTVLMSWNFLLLVLHSARTFERVTWAHDHDTRQCN